jgi:hypothetical protein
MKKAAILIAVALTGCTVPTYQSAHIPDLGLQTVEQVMQWTAENITYVWDRDVHDRLDEWQLPHQTYLWGAGDCEDFSILALYLLDKELGIHGKLELGHNGVEGHAWVSVNGQHWEPQTGSPLTEEYPYSRRTMDHDEAIHAAHTRSIR